MNSSPPPESPVPPPLSTRGERGNGQDQHSGALWPETNWAEIRKMQLSEEEKAQALRYFCEQYDPVILREFRSALKRLGSIDPAEDVKQDFLVWLIEKQQLERARQDRGRLRAYVGTMMRRFLLQRYRRDNALKRGGGVVHEEFIDDLQGRENAEISSWDRQVAGAILNRVAGDLERVWTEKGKLDRLRVLMPAILNTDVPIRSEILGEQMGVADNLARSELSRLRTAFVQLLEAEVSRTLCCAPECLEEEMRFVARAWAYEGAPPT